MKRGLFTRGLGTDTAYFIADLSKIIDEDAYDILYGTEPDLINAEYMKKYGVAYYKRDKNKKKG